eukprot:1469612-Prymnesium_polylepis.1
MERGPPTLFKIPHRVWSGHRFLESTTWTFGNMDMSGCVWICLDIWSVWTCLDISVLTVT